MSARYNTISVENTLLDTSYEAPPYSVTRCSTYYPHTYPSYYTTSCYPYGYFPYSTVAASAVAAANSAAASTVARKNAEISDLSWQHNREKYSLESQLTEARSDNSGLHAELHSTRSQLELERRRAETISLDCKNNIGDLKLSLGEAEAKLASLEPRAELANELETEIAYLKSEIKHVNSTNTLLAEQNSRQASIICRSRPASPVVVQHQTVRSSRSRPTSPPLRVIHHYRSRSISPVYGNDLVTTTTTTIRSRSPSPVFDNSFATTTTVVRSRPVSPVSLRTSPLSPNHCTQVIRQNSLVTRFNDLYARNRSNAMDTLRTYQDDYETNQRIVFAAVQEAFSVAKRAFLNWKCSVRSSVLCSYRNDCDETLEEAVQSHINRNVDLYDLPYMTSEVVAALNQNPKFSLPLGVSYSVIGSFIREACRIAWEMSALAFPLDTAFAVDGECLDSLKYRRTYDSDYCVSLVDHFVWPSLLSGSEVISKGEASTRRFSAAPLVIRNTTYTTTTQTRSISPLPIRSRARSAHFTIRY